MQEFLHTNHDDVQGAVERFKQMISTEKEVYFDVHQIESVFEFYVDKNLLDKAAQILHIGLSQHPQASSLQVKNRITSYNVCYTKLLRVLYVLFLHEYACLYLGVLPIVLLHKQTDAVRLYIQNLPLDA